MNANVRNEAESELVQAIWKEQYDNARRHVLDCQKRRRNEDAQIARGIHLMVLSLYDQLTGFRLSDAVKTGFAADYETFLNLVEQF
jgi:hypothetical protein